MAQTVVEKILSRAARRRVEPGEIVAVEVDCAMATDGSAPMAIDLFEKHWSKVGRPERIVLVKDHYVPCPNDKVAALLSKMDRFAERHGIRIFREGDGICHRLMPEQGYVRPGAVVVGADSHSTTYGALNALGTGIGSSDFAGALLTGQVWLRVPESIRVVLTGAFREGVYAKDLALTMVGTLGADGATYKVLDFSGPGVAGLAMEERFTLCNMGVETGAKAAIMPCDAVTEAWVAANTHLDTDSLRDRTAGDEGARYASEVRFDLAAIEPMVAVPHRVDTVQPAAVLGDRTITSALIGTCTNGSVEDMRIAAGILKSRSLAPGLRLLVVPPSRAILRQAMAEGLIGLFIEKGAVLVPPGCGPCCGAMNGVPAAGEAVISTANRNFKGRMGNVGAEVYLASPATVAASAVTGRITDPRRLADA